MKPTRKCTIPECDKRTHSRGWCEMHYTRWRRHGDPTIRLYASSPEESFAAKTEWRGDCLEWTGITTEHGYGIIVVNRKNVLAHRYSWELTNGKIPTTRILDHSCHNPPCVNPAHLRLATPSQNNSHQNGPSRHRPPGSIRNVYPRGTRWRVYVGKDGTQYYFGTYDDRDEAAVVAERARKELFGEYAGKG